MSTFKEWNITFWNYTGTIFDYVDHKPLSTDYSL